MSLQDKVERILKEIHLLISDGEHTPEDPEKVTIEKKQMFSLLEQLNLVIYEMMDQYEMTAQSRELAQRRAEKKTEAMLERVEKQSEDIYAASLVYTDEALSRVQHLMDKALRDSQKIWKDITLELEKNQQQVRQDQAELREQLQDFKDSNKYLAMIEECNKEREKKKKEEESAAGEKKIQNEARHFATKATPEIKVNPAYFERRGLELPKDTVPVESEPIILDDESKVVTPEVKVNLGAEYFKWKAKRKKNKSEEEA